MTTPAPTADQLMRELCDLIAVPSVNPRTSDAVPCDRPGHGERMVADAVAVMLGGIPGVGVEIDEFTPGRANVVGLLDVGAERTVLFETHLDTVEAADHPHPFDPVVANGEVRGRGACDAKGQIVSQLAALRMLAARRSDLRVNVVLAVVADEEHLYAGVRRMLDAPWMPRVTAALVGEPTELRLVVSHKGVVRGDIVCRGRAAHTSRPDQGENAIEIAADVVAWLRNQAADLPEDPLVGRATLAISGVRGGDGTNVVPAECRLAVDRRTVPGEDPHQVWEELGTALSARLGHSVMLDEPRVTDPALPRVGAGELAAALASAATDAGIDDTAIGVPYGTDGSKIAAREVETIVFGPGRIEDAHTADEAVRVTDLLTAAHVMADAVTRL